MGIDWDPGIGDPSLAGWLTVVCYFLAALICFKAAAGTVSRERWFWIGLVSVLLALGINKQLDLQSLLTELGRAIAERDGWLARRREAQRLFLEVLALSSIAILLCLLLIFRRSRAPLKVSLIGALLLLTFIVARAASFHHVDHLLGWRAGGIKMNWIFELGGIALVAVGALMSARGKRPAPG